MFKKQTLNLEKYTKRTIKNTMYFSAKILRKNCLSESKYTFDENDAFFNQNNLG